jgi:ectoine hydroxylase-related dioxygenase (phytanoyl-CoA dioxygenase family)
VTLLINTSYKFSQKDKYSKNLSGHSTKEDNLGDFSYLSYNINFKPNMLVLFPSYLTHSVSKNLTDIPRKSLAFNVIPKNGFGKEGNLNELKFNN